MTVGITAKNWYTTTTGHTENNKYDSKSASSKNSESSVDGDNINYEKEEPMESQSPWCAVLTGRNCAKPTK